MILKNKENINPSEKGVALITSILAVLLATLLGFALITLGLNSMGISSNGIQQTEAFYISEAGLAHASQLVTSAGEAEFTNILAAGDGIAGNGDELSTQPVAGTPIPLAGLPFGRGSYTVTVSDDLADTDGDLNADSNGQIVITSTGIGLDGATATTEIIIAVGTSTPPYPGFLAAGDVKSSNNAYVTGPNATIQINGDLISSGYICAEQNIIMGGDGNSANLGLLMTDSSCSTISQAGTTLLLNQPPLPPPIIDTAKLRSDFRSKADYVFKSNGSIYPQSNGIQSPALNSAEISSLGFDPWVLGSKTTWIYNSPIVPPNGTYYFEESSVKLNHGDKTKTVQMTILSEGSIQIDDGQAFEPSLPGYSLVAANDIAIVADLATGSITNPGLIYAYGQLEFSNKSNVFGSVIGANFYQPDGTYGPDINDVGGANIAKGSDGAIHIGNLVTIVTTNMGGSGSSTATPTIISWREIRY